MLLFRRLQMISIMKDYRFLIVVYGTRDESALTNLVGSARGGKINALAVREGRAQ
jgi:hypothetical protein